ncbi:MAG TPA: APC family permease [Labilithrix sp.]|nr:APC family permease [Labilithrix sp.]
MSWRDLLFGRPLATMEDERERVSPMAGVGILGLDALASAAYGPEALLTVLLPLGTAGPRYAAPLTLVIVLLLIIVATSYRQTIHAYPDGGGAYTVAKANLGITASLFAASALALDYILNVSVAVSAGVGALVSAVPELLPHTLKLCLAIVVVLTAINLRGVRSTGFVFLTPTYLFLGTLFAVIGMGVAKTILHSGHPLPVVPSPPASTTMGVAPAWLLMRAFANGCTAMTGIEAVSNGIPIFHAPATVGARRTLTAIVAALVALLVGIAILALAYGITATPPGEPGYESVVSRVTSAVVGRGVFYYVTIGSVVTVLAFSANTSFADFPRVCRMLAGDGFLPEAFGHRGRRLTFSLGIVVLAAMSAGPLVAFGGITDALIPLFAVGALSAFTISQIGMVVHWRKQDGALVTRALVLNAAGAIATGATLLVVLASKFQHGAWISLTLIAAMILLFKKVRAHYDHLAKVTVATDSLTLGPALPPLAVVPMRGWDALTLKAMRFATAIADEVIAVQVLTGERSVDDLTDRWNALAVEPSRAGGRTPPRLVVLRSEYRELYGPLIDFVTQLEREHPERPLTIIVPELVERRWYRNLLDPHGASLMKALLLFRGGPQTVIVTTPFYIEGSKPERPSVWRAAPAAAAQWRRKLFRAPISRTRRSGCRYRG